MIRAIQFGRSPGGTAAFPKSADARSNTVSATLNQSGREADTSMRRSSY